MNRKERAQMAQITIDILEKGFYHTEDNIRVDIQADLKRCIDETLLYQPKELEELNKIIFDKGEKYSTEIEINNETTLDAANRLRSKDISDHILCLNFASAKNPGGGFLGGSQAQEESLARSSGLYSSLMERHEYYDYNRKCSTSLYSNYMIYSPNVPVFRSDNGELLKNYYSVSFITAPAVNAGAVLKNEKRKIEQIIPTMINRTEKVLSVAFNHQVDCLVLGAWGCGVFKNNPADIAEIWFNHLMNAETFKGRFKKIVFAVPGNTYSNYKAFHETFSKYGV